MGSAWSALANHPAFVTENLQAGPAPALPSWPPCLLLTGAGKGARLPEIRRKAAKGSVIVSKRELLTGAVAGATAFGLHKSNILNRVPSIGPVSGPVVAIVVGLAVLAFVKVDGIPGDVIDGVAFGVVAIAAGEL